MIVADGRVCAGRSMVLASEVGARQPCLGSSQEEQPIRCAGGISVSPEHPSIPPSCPTKKGKLPVVFLQKYDAWCLPIFVVLFIFSKVDGVPRTRYLPGLVP